MPSAAQLAVLISYDEQNGALLGQVKGHIQEIGVVAGQAGPHVSTFGGFLAQAGAIAAGFTVSSVIQRLPGMLSDIVSGAAAEQASLARLQQAVDNAGESYITYAAELEKAAQQGQKFGYDSEATNKALALLVAQTGSASEALSRLSIAQDLAAGTGMDLQTAAKLVGKITDDNVNVLGRYGIVISKTATEEEALAKIEGTFGGQAAQHADTAAGAFERFKTSAKELGDALGSLVLPALSTLANMLASVISKVADAVNFLDKLTGGGGSAANAMDALKKQTIDAGGSVDDYIGELDALIGAYESVGADASALKAEEDRVRQSTDDTSQSMAQLTQKLADQAQAAESATKSMTVLNMATTLLNDTDAAATQRAQDYAIWLKNLEDQARATGQSLQDMASQQNISLGFTDFTGLTPATPRAGGGPVSAGVPYWVGEGGRRELFVPNQAGAIYSDAMASGSGGSGDQPVNLTVNIDGLKSFVLRTTFKALAAGEFRGAIPA